MKFKKLEIEQEGKWWQRLIKSKDNQKTLLYAVIGAMGGVAYHYFNGGIEADVFLTEELGRSVMMGTFLGIFITNSPCARGKC